MPEIKEELATTSDLTNPDWLNNQAKWVEDPDKLILVSADGKKILELDRLGELFLKEGNLTIAVSSLLGRENGKYRAIHNVFMIKLARSNRQFIKDFLDRIVENPAEGKKQ